VTLFTLMYLAEGFTLGEFAFKAAVYTFYQFINQTHDLIVANLLVRFELQEWYLLK